MEYPKTTKNIGQPCVICGQPTNLQRALDVEREKVRELEQKGLQLFEWRLALHSLTPGGSEFCTPDACESWVRKSRASQHEYIIEQIKQRKELQAQLATLQAQLRQVEGERDTARHRVDELEAREIDVEILQGDLTTLRQFGEDARRYRRLQVLGCAPSTSKQLENGTVLCFTNLDEFVDADLKAVPSRGEAAQDAGKGANNGV